MLGMQEEYYLFKKYGHTYKFLQYSNAEYDCGNITVATMFTMPMPVLIDIYKQHYKVAPKSFMDCGAGFGYMVRWAKIMGLDACGIENHKYPHIDSIYKRFFNNGRIKISDLLDVEPFTQDLAYANCSLTYLAEKDIDAAISKFKNVKMLVAIHTTTEDVTAAKNLGMKLDIDFQTRLLRSNDWWLERFRKNGFDATFNEKHRCFCVVPKTR